LGVRNTQSGMARLADYRLPSRPKVIVLEGARMIILESRTYIAGEAKWQCGLARDRLGIRSGLLQASDHRVVATFGHNGPNRPSQPAHERPAGAHPPRRVEDDNGIRFRRRSSVSWWLPSAIQASPASRLRCFARHSPSEGFTHPDFQ
jgi:hypothetical protein